MNWNEIEQLWRGQTPAAAPAAIPDLPTLEARQRQLARSLSRRDWLEAGTALAVAGVFAAVAAVTRLPVLPVGLSIGLLVLLAGFFAKERLQARRQRPRAEVPVRDRIQAEIQLVRRQRRLLQGVLWWYLLPIAAALALFFSAVVMAAPPAIQAALVPKLCWFGVVYAAFLVFVWWLNQRAIRTELQPRLRDLERTYEALSGRE